MSIHNNPAALGKIVVAAAGTPVSILSNFEGDQDYYGMQANKIILQALPTNTGNVYLGYSDMDTSTGEGVLAELTPGTMWSITDPSAANVFAVGIYYLDAASDGDGAYAAAHVR